MTFSLSCQYFFIFYGNVLLCEKISDNLICLSILPFTEVCMSDIASFIDDIHRWPILVIICTPSRKSIIECYWIGDSCFFHRSEDILVLLLIGELGCMYTNYDKSLISVFLVECFDVWYSCLTIATTKCPEFDNHDLTTESCEREWIRVDPIR